MKNNWPLKPSDHLVLTRPSLAASIFNMNVWSPTSVLQTKALSGECIMRHLRIFIAVTFTFAMCNCSRGPGGEIETVLNKCAQYTQQVNASKMSAAESALFFADKMQAIDTRGCPQDFRIAFQQHINAWRDAAPAYSQNTTLNVFLEAFAGGLANEYSQIGASQQGAAIATARINSTYERLTEIAASHGARIPRSVVEK